MRVSKKMITFFVSVLFVMFTLTGCIGDTYKSLEDSIPTIKVQGKGIVEIQPDEAVVRFGVTSNDKALARAYKQNTAKMNDIINRVANLGIEKKDIQTANYSVRPIYAKDSEGRQIPGKIAVFRIDQQVTVTIRDIAKISSVVDQVMIGGTNVFNGIQFTSSDIESFKIEAKIQAAKEAKKKAGLLTKSLGVKTGRVISIAESGGYYAPRKMRSLNVARSESAPMIEPGSIEVTATCNVTYEILQ